MKQAQSIIYRYLTEADFFNMYKPPKTEAGGGGQLYIDFLTSSIPVPSWDRFFNGVRNLKRTVVTNGPQWMFPIHSIGITSAKQTLRIYQRREASICIPNQNINTRSANRVHAWSPNNGFPKPDNPENRNSLPAGLAVYLVRTTDNKVWAGWFQQSDGIGEPCRNDAGRQLLDSMLNSKKAGDVGMLEFVSKNLLLDTNTHAAPLVGVEPSNPSHVSATLNNVSELGQTENSTNTVKLRTSSTTTGSQSKTEDELTDFLFREDEKGNNEQLEQYREAVVTVRQRNQTIVQALKELYNNECQLTGQEFTFLKRDGTPYTEAHHLIALGQGGADDPRNIIIVSPLIHRMLHYAQVEGIALNKIVEQTDGSATLDIEINNTPYTITWLPKHAQCVLSVSDHRD